MYFLYCAGVHQEGGDILLVGLHFLLGIPRQGDRDEVVLVLEQESDLDADKSQSVYERPLAMIVYINISVHLYLHSNSFRTEFRKLCSILLKAHRYEFHLLLCRSQR